MRGDLITPLVTILVGAASGIYIFQPLVLEQLKKDGNLNPKYGKEAEEAAKYMQEANASKPPKEK